MAEIGDVRRELIEFLDMAAGTHAFALGGLAKVRQEMSDAQPLASNPDPKILWGTGDPNIPGNIKTSRGWRRTTLLDALQQDGTSDMYLGWAWVTLVFDRWEDDFRHRFASALGCGHKDVRSDPIGDLRRLRNDVSHSKGIATAAESGKCKIFQSWFTLGSPILIGQNQVASFVNLMEAQDSVKMAGSIS